MTCGVGTKAPLELQLFAACVSVAKCALQRNRVRSDSHFLNARLAACELDLVFDLERTLVFFGREFYFGCDNGLLSWERKYQLAGLFAMEDLQDIAAGNLDGEASDLMCGCAELFPGVGRWCQASRLWWLVW